MFPFPKMFLKETNHALVRHPKRMKNSGKISPTLVDFLFLSLVIVKLISFNVNLADIMPLQTAFLSLVSFFSICSKLFMCWRVLDISITRLAIRLGMIFEKLDFGDLSDLNLRRRHHALWLECLKSVFYQLYSLSRRWLFNTSSVFFASSLILDRLKVVYSVSHS